jgi:hypothetical protein
MSGVTNPLSRKKASKVRNRRGHERSGECKQHETLVDSATAPIQVSSQKQINSVVVSLLNAGSGAQQIASANWV